MSAPTAALVRGTATAWGRRGGLVALLAGLLLLGDAIVAGELLSEILEDTASQRDRQWFGLVAALGTIVLLSILIAAIRHYAVRQAEKAAGRASEPIPGILIGADNRLSTSKLSAFAWTWVIAWALLSLAFADWVGAHAGWQAFLKQGLQGEYLVLLGVPFAALVGAKALVSSKVEGGTLVKVPASDAETTPAHRIAQAFSNDSGQTDLVDTQYLLFGAIALLVFIVMFAQSPSAGLPVLPEALVGLASVGATAYVANKWTAQDAKPHVERILPNSAKRGATIVVYGTNLLTVSLGGKQAPATEQLEVFFGSRAEQAVDPRGSGAKANASGSDYIRLSVPYVPDGAFDAEGKCHVDVAVRNAIGVISDTAPFTIER